MANPKQTSSSDFGTLAREIFQATPAYIFVSALREVLKARRRTSVSGRTAGAVAR